MPSCGGGAALEPAAAREVSATRRQGEADSPFAATLLVVSRVVRPSSVVVCLLVLAILPDCGARTSLEQTQAVEEACEETGETRACHDACGTGVETCAAGFWGSCQVLNVPCSGVCGVGVQTCTDGKLGECVIVVAQRDCSSTCGMGHEKCEAGAWGACDAPQPKGLVLHTTIRDFHKTQPDFELPVSGNVIDLGMVEPNLGADRKPVYAGMPSTPTTPSGKASFDTWFHDTPGVNQSISYDLPLKVGGDHIGNNVFVDVDFFPIDNQLFGNEGFAHNYHFTLELHTTFTYRQNMEFSFSTDDDMWVFVADRLEVDMGGVHRMGPENIWVNRLANEYGWQEGQTFSLEVFFAERRSPGSMFALFSTAGEPGPCE